METYRLKNIVIVLLVFVNIFLLGLFVSNYSARRAARQELVSQTVSLLAESGISVDSEKISDLALPDTLTLSRDESLELSLIRYVLGNVKRTDEGGGVYYYQNEKGTATFRGNGSFEINIRSSDSVAPLAFAEDFCKKFGYSDMSFTTNSGWTTVTASAAADGIPVYNCTLTMRFSGQHLSAVSGYYVSSSTAESSSGSDGISAVSALVSMLDYCTREGTICNAVTDMSVGYILQSTASTPLALVPVWKISSDSYTYYVNSTDGSVELA